MAALAYAQVYDPSSGLSEEEHLTLLLLADEETDAERQLRLEQQEIADAESRRYLAEQGLLEEKGMPQLPARQVSLIDYDAMIAAAYQDNQFVPGVEADHLVAKALAERLEWEELVNERKAIELRTAEEEKATAEVMYDSFVNIPVRNGVLIYACPHCRRRVATLQREIACTIFTHGATRVGQVNQHLTPEQAAAIKASGAVQAGCMLQYFLQTNPDGTYTAVQCSGR